MEVKFLVKQNKGKFNSVGADMFLEQRNIVSATVQLSWRQKKNNFTVRNLIYHEMFAVNNKTEN